MRNPAGTTKALGDLGNSTIKETGNILASAYLNGLQRVLRPAPAAQRARAHLDLSHAVLELAAEGVERSAGKLLSIGIDVTVEGTGITGKLFLFIDESSEPVLVENASGVL